MDSPISAPRYETILFGTSSGVAEIRFNRPHRLNAVVEAFYDELLDALRRAEADPAVKTIVLTGEGRAFCVGADMKEHGRNARTSWERREYLLRGNDVCRAIHRNRKPVVAAVNGFALGAGAEMAISADFLVMRDDAQIALPEVSIGTHVGGAVTSILPRLVGLAKAREMIFLGARIDGVEAKRIGLAYASAPAESFEAAVHALTASLAEKAPVSMAFAKDHLNVGNTRDYETLLSTEIEACFACTLTQDWQEGVDAFAQKRKPVFTGR